MNEIICADCLDILKSMPDKSVDLVLTDPPYNIGKADWDKIPDYVEWCGKWMLECQRVLKDNGSLYFWHNDMEQIAQLMEWIRQHSSFVFNSFIIWNKGNFRAQAWINPSKDSELRSWFGTTEYCLYYTFQDESGLSMVFADKGCFQSIKGYLDDELAKSGHTEQSIGAVLGTMMSSHYFGFSKRDKSEWCLPTEEQYAKLQTTGAFSREYESLRQEYESLRYVHHVDHRHNNVWETRGQNDGTNHPCEKPLSLISRIIETSSNEGDTILDPFVGSGTTCVAAKILGRKYIGIEISPVYAAIARKRVEQAQYEERLFAGVAS